MAKVNFKRCQSISDLSNIDIMDGNFIVTGDGKTYVDYGENRIGIGGTPDLEMSDSSTNTVQNKIIKAYVDNMIPKGIINTYAGSTAPSGWLICDGTAVSRSTYSDLFDVIGTTYGTGDGSSTFNLPNLKRRVPAGYDISDSDFNALGKTGGEKTHTLTIDEIPEHNHVQNLGQASTTVAPSPGSGIIGTANNSTTSSSGGGQSHNILQPYITLNYIIKY